MWMTGQREELIKGSMNLDVFCQSTDVFPSKL